ncbi:MAG: protein kinase domain-containing protein [Limisphaerales bacterium]
MELQLTPRHEAQVRDFLTRHRVGLLTILFTDIVGSVELKRHLGDVSAILNIQRHHALVREILTGFPEGEEIETAGESFLLVIAKPAEAVKFALTLPARLRAQGAEAGVTIRDRVGIHLGEVLIAGEADSSQKSLFGSQVDTAARVMSLAGAGQILVTRAVFDNARQVLKGRDLPGVGELLWMNHGSYLLKGVEGALDICEAGEVGLAPLKPPADSSNASRQVSADGEPVLGWRPAVGQVIPKTQWELTEKLGEGGFGEVWLARHQTLKDARVFKFCFRADRVRSLKREVTLFRLLRERVGDHPRIVRLMDIYFEEPPYYLEMEYVPGRDLATWVKEQGGLENVPMSVRLEIVAQVADALQAAHDCGIIHRDIKPSNILISSSPSPPSGERGLPTPQLSVKLTDFGIGQIVSDEALGELTKAGFTQTLLGSTAGSYSGTRLYMAPELLTGQKATPRSDIYSLGVVLYQLAAGDLGRPLTVNWAKTFDFPLLTEDLEKCFNDKLEDRFASSGDLCSNLRALEQRRITRSLVETSRKRQAWLFRLFRQTAALLLVLSAGIGAFILFRDSQAAKFGGLEINSEPEGAQVWLQGRQLGVTPYEAPRLSPGILTYSLALENFEPVTNTVTVTARKVRSDFSFLRQLATTGTNTSGGARTNVTEIAGVGLEGVNVIVVEGTVEIAKNGATQWMSAAQGTVLSAGDRLRTGSESRASLRFSDGSIKRLNEHTTLTIITRATFPGKALELREGELFFNSGSPTEPNFKPKKTVRGVIRG